MGLRSCHIQDLVGMGFWELRRMMEQFRMRFYLLGKLRRLLRLWGL